MSWKIRLLDHDPRDRDEPFEIGDAWFDDCVLKRGDAVQHKLLSPRYFRENHGLRLPLYVVLPDYAGALRKQVFCVDAPFYRDGEAYGDGWGFSGEAPNITLTPSININGSYHGHIQNGVITDDCEGRK